MASIEVKNFANDADEVSTPNNARVETVNVGGQRVMKICVQPGWKWSNDIKPVVGTCLLYTSPSPRDRTRSRMPSSA